MLEAVAAATTMADGLANVTANITSLVGVIEGNAILMTLFCGGLMVASAKIFKHIKKAVR